MSAAPMVSRNDERRQLQRTILAGLPDLVRETGSKRVAAYKMGVSQAWLQKLECGRPDLAIGVLREAAAKAEAARLRAQHQRAARAATELALDAREDGHERAAAIEAGVRTGKVLRWRPRPGKRACLPPRGAA